MQNQQRVVGNQIRVRDYKRAPYNALCGIYYNILYCITSSDLTSLCFHM